MKYRYNDGADADRQVAPARERGLKLLLNCLPLKHLLGRSREGAWIEIDGNVTISVGGGSRSREGAWIEISLIFYAP